MAVSEPTLQRLFQQRVDSEATAYDMQLAMVRFMNQVNEGMKLPPRRRRPAFLKYGVTLRKFSCRAATMLNEVFVNR